MAKMVIEIGAGPAPASMTGLKSKAKGGMSYRDMMKEANGGEEDMSMMKGMGMKKSGMKGMDMEKENEDNCLELCGKIDGQEIDITFCKTKGEEMPMDIEELKKYVAFALSKATGNKWEEETESENEDYAEENNGSTTEGA